MRHSVGRHGLDHILYLDIFGFKLLLAFGKLLVLLSKLLFPFNKLLVLLSKFVFLLRQLFFLLHYLRVKVFYRREIFVLHIHVLPHHRVCCSSSKAVQDIHHVSIILIAGLVYSEQLCLVGIHVRLVKHTEYFLQMIVYSPPQQRNLYDDAVVHETVYKRIRYSLCHDIAIQYDAAAQAPYYHYTDRGGREHAVWFEDARSIEAKLRLADEYHLQGVGYWNLTRPFPQNWAVLASLFDIETLL